MASGGGEAKTGTQGADQEAQGESSEQLTKFVSVMCNNIN